MKKEKLVKLELINMLSDSTTVLKEVTVSHDTDIVVDHPLDPSSTTSKVPNGHSTYIISVYTPEK